MRKPFWKTSHNSWYCEIGRKQIRLGPDKETAFEEYHKLMAGSQPVTSKTTMQMLADEFLVQTKLTKAATTYDWYLGLCQSFIDFVGPKLRVNEVKGNHVTRWLQRKFAGKSPSYQNGACRAISRIFNWAISQGIVQFNPCTRMERPQPESREVYTTPEQWQQIVDALGVDDPLYDFLNFMHETGCRPQEARLVQSYHWDFDDERLILERKNSKGKKVKRVIRLHEAATKIIAKQAKKNPGGHLFLNRKGKPWTGSALNQATDALREKLDFDFIPYHLRHTWCTDALARGVDMKTTSIFMGHKDATMVMKVYSHLETQEDFLAEKLKQATTTKPLAPKDVA